MERSAAERLIESVVQALVHVEIDSADTEFRLAAGAVRARTGTFTARFSSAYGRTGALSEVLSAYGYMTRESDPFFLQYLYDESKFTALADALTALGKSSANFETAKKNDDDAAVQDMWGDE